MEGSKFEMEEWIKMPASPALKERHKLTEEFLEEHGYLHVEEVLDRIKSEWIKQFGDLNKNIDNLEGVGYFIAGFVASALKQQKCKQSKSIPIQT